MLIKEIKLKSVSPKCQKMLKEALAVMTEEDLINIQKYFEDTKKIKFGV